jgi:O-antigen ligase/cytochrome c-type biogenesis protein CcmH/NrfG
VKHVRARGTRGNALAASRVDVECSKLRLLGVALVCAKLALVPVVIDPSSDMPFIVPKVLISHGLSYVLAGVIAGLAVQFGRALFVRSWLHLPITGYLLANIAATVLAVDPVLALYGTHARMLGLGSIADGVLLYLAVVLLVRRRVEVVAVLVSVLMASAIVIAYELVQLAGKDPFIWSYDGSVSPFSTLGQPTTLAYYLTIVAVVALAIGASVPDLNRPLRVVLILYSGLLVVGAAATGTRSALVGVVVGGAVLGALLWMRQGTRRARVFTGLGLAAAGVALAVAVVASPIGARLTATVQAPNSGETDDLVARLDPSSIVRVALYSIAVEMVRDRPLLGYGPDNFVVGVPEHRPEGAPPQIRQSLASSAHSWLAYVATSSGVIGLIFFIAIVAGALALAWRVRAHPLVPTTAAAIAAYLATGLTTVTDVATDALFWLGIGVVAAITAPFLWPEGQEGRMTRESKKARPRGSLVDHAIASVLVLVGAALLIGTTRAAEASRSARTSQDSRLVRAIPQAIEAGARATELDPGRAEYWHQFGLAYVGASRWRDAATSFERAVRLAPYDIRNINDLAAVHLILFNSGDGAARARIVELAEQAVRTDPNNPGAHLTRATVMHATGSIPEAVLSVERALALDAQSMNERLYATAARVYIDAGRVPDAVRIARQGRAVLGVTNTAALGFELARALFVVGQTREALAEIDLVLSIQPNYPAAERLRSEIRARL